LFTVSHLVSLFVEFFKTVIDLTCNIFLE
jgi:hypothetical protein